MDVGDVAAAKPRLLEGDAGDARDLVLVVDHRVHGPPRSLRPLAPARLAEVDPARQLAHDQHVDAVDDLGPQRRGVDERREDRRRPQVREEPERLADPEQPLLRPHVHRHRIPFRSADGAEQDRAALAAGLDDLVAQRRAVFVDRAAADQLGLELELDAELLARRHEHALRLLRHLGPDPVAGQEYDSLCH